METLLIVGLVVGLFVLGYLFIREMNEKKQVVGELGETRSAIRELASNFDDDVCAAQNFAANQDKIAEEAENARVAALKLANDKREERETAVDLANKKRRALDLFTKL